MKEKTCQTRCGTIRYWVSVSNPDTITLVFLPGLTADHRLFDKQIQYFESRYNVIVWDAPAHGSSWPFRFDFDLFDKAKWLNDILIREGITKPVIAGQSMGGYVGQAYAQLYPDKMTGFVSIDSAPLQRSYVTAVEIWLLKRMEPVYAHYPWKWLLKSGSEGVATSDYGRNLLIMAASIERREFVVHTVSFLVFSSAVLMRALFVRSVVPWTRSLLKTSSASSIRIAVTASFRLNLQARSQQAKTFSSLPSFNV